LKSFPAVTAANQLLCHWTADIWLHHASRVASKLQSKAHWIAWDNQDFSHEKFDF
jgi:hypothetical protein